MRAALEAALAGEEGVCSRVSYESCGSISPHLPAERATPLLAQDARYSTTVPPRLATGDVYVHRYAEQPARAFLSPPAVQLVCGRSDATNHKGADVYAGRHHWQALRGVPSALGRTWIFCLCTPFRADLAQSGAAQSAAAATAVAASAAASASAARSPGCSSHCGLL